MRKIEQYVAEFNRRYAKRYRAAFSPSAERGWYYVIVWDTNTHKAFPTYCMACAFLPLVYDEKLTETILHSEV